MKIAIDGDKSTLLKHQLDMGLEETYLTNEECKIKCDMDPKCKSFVYSEKKQNCVRRIVDIRKVNNRDKTKTKEDKFEDYRWCSKSNKLILQ